MTAAAPGREPEELVVLLDDEGRATGTAPKRTVHHRATPLHLAVSCYVFDEQGALLVTRRALGKPTWPGVWTNSVCGHPFPGEPLVDAVRRRGLDELGVHLVDVRLVLPTFRYRAEMPGGVVENEMCPVFTAVTADPVRAVPAEVDDFAWVDWADFRRSVLDGGRAVSPWCVEQVRLLPEDPRSAAQADADRLPPAARPATAS
jgi:isopentenyl-diphosphate delta-isomerase